MAILWVIINVILSCNFLFFMTAGNQKIKDRERRLIYFSNLVLVLVAFGILSQVLESISVISSAIPIGNTWYDILFNLSWLYLIAQIASLVVSKQKGTVMSQ